MPDNIVLYVTGAPASGKSTTIAAMRLRVPDLACFDYGAELLCLINAGREREVSYDELRRDSAALVEPKHVKLMDERLIDWVNETRGKQPVVIDSHAVTRESYGFRVTPFSTQQWLRLRPTHIFSLYASPDTVANRLEKDPAGRLSSDAFHVGLHAGMQMSVAISYCIALGVPLEVINTETTDSAGVATRILVAAGLG